MRDFLCLAPGEREPSPDDLNTVARFRQSLERIGEYRRAGVDAGEVELLLDGDAATVLPDIVERDDYVIVDGQLHVRGLGPQ